MKSSYRVHIEACNETSREAYADKKNKVYAKYQQLEEEEIMRKVKYVKEAHDSQQHGKCWSLVNDIAGRRSAQSWQIKGEIQEQRIEAWHQHFLKLHGSPTL